MIYRKHAIALLPQLLFVILWNIFGVFLGWDSNQILVLIGFVTISLICFAPTLYKWLTFAISIDKRRLVIHSFTLLETTDHIFVRNGLTDIHLQQGHVWSRLFDYGSLLISSPNGTMRIDHVYPFAELKQQLTRS